MTLDHFNVLTEEQMDRSSSVLSDKAKEYATEDRLHNFKVAAALQGVTHVKALAGMMSKHTVSIYDMCWSGLDYGLKVWQEKITDAINYLLLLNAMVREQETSRILRPVTAEERPEEDQPAAAVGSPELLAGEHGQPEMPMLSKQSPKKTHHKTS